MRFLYFLAGVAFLLSIVPLATWAATGKAREAWHAFKAYLFCLGLLVAASAFFVLAFVIGSAA